MNLNAIKISLVFALLTVGGCKNYNELVVNPNLPTSVPASLLFTNVHIEAGAQVQECVVLPQVKIGEGCRIRRAIVERGCVIPPGMVIGEDPLADAQRFSVTPGGVTLVIPEMLGQALHHAR